MMTKREFLKTVKGVFFISRRNNNKINDYDNNKLQLESEELLALILSSDWNVCFYDVT